eukprot:1014052-Amorphochlora_amoeboformis.AAC.1
MYGWNLNSRHGIGTAIETDASPTNSRVSGYLNIITNSREQACPEPNRSRNDFQEHQTQAQENTKVLHLVQRFTNSSSGLLTYTRAGGMCLERNSGFEECW